MNLTARAALSRVCGYLGACLVLGMGAQYLGVVAYLTAQGSATPGEPAVTAARLRQVVERGDADALLWATVIAAPVFLLVTWLFRRFVDRAPLSGVGFEGRARWSRFFLGWSAGLWLPGLLLGLGLLTGAYRWGGIGSWNGGGTHAGGATIAGGILLYALGFVLQGSSEELIVRGYVQRTLLAWKPEGPGRLLWVVFAPSLLFAAGHLGNPAFTPLAFVNTLLAGVVFALLVLRQGSLWAAMGAHAGWNFGLGVIWSLPVSGLAPRHLLDVQLVDGASASWLLGGAYGPESGVATTLLYTGIALLLRNPRDSGAT
ncbi:MAG: CPBP family intramembrane metalloprotease [Candidatus Eisenbacteria bacterium]|nr:CPBP family intramembrane metalloprotease [Candidatus Eisenbacteria bacterium]